MPPKDITELGPLNWRELQEENKINNNTDGFWSLPTSQRVAIIKQRERSMLPTETLTENEVPEGFGRSRFDKDVPLYALDDIEDWRAREQSGLEKIANGIIKGAITTGTTFVDMLAGIPVGVLTAVSEGRLSGIWDNAITNAMQDVSDWQEETFPNYYTNAQRESEWYDPVNLFSANFLGDKLIKNFGFSAGAGLGMKAVSRIPKLLPKLAKNLNTAKAINTAETSFVGAVGEGSIEALNGTKEWAEQNRNAIESERSQSLADLDMKYSILMESLKNDYAGSEMYNSLYNSLYNEYQKEAAQINNTADGKIEALQNQIDTQGNLILAGNIPILWGSNIITLGKMIGRGYVNAQSSTNGFVRDAILEGGRKGYESTLTSARQALRYAKTPFFEGIEEMNQAVISTAAKNRAQDYYNMAVDPDATEATKSYMGYIWDALGKTYGDISNYEEFIIGMLSSGISDIVIGQGKALRDERRQVNENVARANEAINNFNNRTLLRNMNIQQVLEDQKLEAALNNDKKSFKDSEFGQIASAVIAFSQIGKIEDLKAMLTENLDNMTDSDLENIANELSQKDDSGAETNAFVLMSNEQRREYLKKQKKAYDKTIDDYNNIREGLIEQSGSLFSPEQQAELIFYKLRANNANDRINEIDNDIQTKILNETVWTPQTLKKLGLDEERVYTKQEVADAVANFNGSDKQLANLFKGQSVEQLFLDKDFLKEDVRKYNDTVLDFIANPQKLEKKNNKISNNIRSIFTRRKVEKVIPEFKNINTFNEFSDKLSKVDPKIRKNVLDELIKQGHNEAKQFKEKIDFSRYAQEFLMESEEDPEIINTAADLISTAVNEGSVKNASDLNNPLYSRENNKDLSDAEYDKLIGLIGDIVKHSVSESAEPITKESPIEEKEETKTDISSESMEDTLARLSKNISMEDVEEDFELDNDSNNQTETFPETTTNENPTLVEENTSVLGTPTANNNCNDTTKDIDTNDTNTVKNEITTPSIDSLSMGMQDIDTKKDNPFVGIPVIDQKDKDGKPTRVAIEATPLYNRLKELGAFDNVNNGVVKIGSKIRFAIDPTLKGDHDVNGETVTYEESPILLYVDDKCVGSLTNNKAKALGIREKLEEEFAGSSNDSIHISNRYYTLVNEIWAGRIKFEKSGTWNLDNNNISVIRERMSGPNINQDNINPIITVFNPNSNSFENSPTGTKYYLGRQVSNVFEDMFYKGSVVLLVPTAAYDSTAEVQPDHAFLPVRLDRILARELDPESNIRKELRKEISKIFNADTTASMLDEIVGRIKSLITYNYHINPTEEVSVHIDPCAKNDDGEIVATTNHSYFRNHNLDQRNSTFTYLRIRFKVGDRDVKTYTINTHYGNVKHTNRFSDDIVNEYTNALESLFLNELNSYVNIDKNKLVDKNYVDKLMKDKALRTNVQDFRVRGNSFSMEPRIYDEEDNTNQPEEVTQSEQVQPESTNNIVPDVDDDMMSYRKEELRTTESLIDINKEVDRIMKMLPQLDRDKVFKVVKTLIDVNNKGDKAMGSFFRGIITISDLAESGTAYHEAFHLVFNMILDRDERTSLLNEYKHKYPNLTQLRCEEQMAEDFRDFMMSREDRSIARIILDFFKDLLNIVTHLSHNRMTFNTVASKIWMSRYKNRDLKNTEQRRNQSEEYTTEMQQIKDRAIANGTFMKAPNGKPTNLNERQWLQVRTKAFKDWFGDWENDSKNASKVVDENGEPLVVYHGTPSFGFNIFDLNVKSIKDRTEQGVKKQIYFTKDREVAEEFAISNNIINALKLQIADNNEVDLKYYAPYLGLEEDTANKLLDDLYYGEFNNELQSYNNKVYAVFLNIKNPVNINAEGKAVYQLSENERNKIGSTDGAIITNVLESLRTDVLEQLPNADRHLRKPITIDYLVNNPNQIKSATDNIGTFSRENDDIRYRLLQSQDMIVYEDYEGLKVNLYGNTYGVEDLSIERFQRLADNIINNIHYNTKTKTVDMNNQWGLWVDKWKRIGVNIKGHKSRGKYIVDDITLDYDNPIIRDIEKFKQNRNRTLLDEKIKQCEY